MMQYFRLIQWSFVFCALQLTQDKERIRKTHLAELERCIDEIESKIRHVKQNTGNRSSADDVMSEAPAASAQSKTNAQVAKRIKTEPESLVPSSIESIEAKKKLLAPLQQQNIRDDLSVFSSAYWRFVCRHLLTSTRVWLGWKSYRKQTETLSNYTRSCRKTFLTKNDLDSRYFHCVLYGALFRQVPLLFLFVSIFS